MTEAQWQKLVDEIERRKNKSRPIFGEHIVLRDLLTWLENHKEEFVDG